jgi:alpha-amylase
MSAVCFYFQVHQPFRIKKYRFFDIGKDHDYFSSPSDDQNNQKILQKVAHKCYLPTNNLLLKLLDEYPEFKISFSLSGVFLEQIEHDFPEVLDSFKKLVETGQCEILEETYYHSLAFLYSKSEFKAQVQKHSQIVQRLFGVCPKVFRNTELIYNNEVAQEVEKMGYKGIITEGADRVLEWKSPNFLYRPKGTKKIKLLLKNYQLSDDIAFRFSNQAWQDFPLTADKFSNWVNQINGNGEVVNLFMDYETFGEHQWAETGIFEFLKDLPAKILANPDNTFVTPSEAIARFETVGEMDIPDYISWADSERDLSAWRSNEMQVDALQTLYKLETEIKDSGDFELLEDWRKLQTSDHFYYMCTKFWSDGDVHKYFSPYQSPYEAFIYFMNAFHDLQARLKLVGKQELGKGKVAKVVS